MNLLPRYKAFLATNHTNPYDNRDYLEWHGGIEQYGYWAVLVDHPSWILAFNQARRELLPFVYPEYQRAPHITIACCGLIHPSYFADGLIRQQIDTLRQASIPQFILEVNGLDSFASVPYLRVVDLSDSLNHIRHLLRRTAKEDNPGRFIPHVTLGQYCDTFETQKIVNVLERISLPEIDPLSVVEVAFCTYDTHSIQGPFAVVERVRLKG